MMGADYSWSHYNYSNVILILFRPRGGHMSGKVSSIMEQLIVLEKLLRRVVRLHALRTNEALKRRSA